jgi:hypothetical protein
MFRLPPDWTPPPIDMEASDRRFVELLRAISLDISNKEASSQST